MLPPPSPSLRNARAERRYGGSWQEGGARAASPPLQGLAPPACRPAHAPPARRWRRVRVPRAFKRPAKTFVWWWCGGGGTNSELYTSGWLPLIGGSILCTTSLQARSRVAVSARPRAFCMDTCPRSGSLAGRENACSRGPARAVHALDGQVAIRVVRAREAAGRYPRRQRARAQARQRLCGS